ncbi:MAG: orotate phosphoribosyltransferase [Candidatus Bathyarchaeota archaeon]
MSRLNQREKLQKDLCEILARIGALKFGVFTLPDGKLSPYYVDLRVVPSFPEAFSKVEKLYLEVAKKDLKLEDIKRIVGIPTAGVPFAAVLAFSLAKPFLYIRKDATSGRERKVEGILNPGDTVLIVDDLVTSGKTVMAAADAIRSEGGVVKEALVLIDRQEGGRIALEKRGIRLHHLILMSETAKILYSMGVIDKEQLSIISKQFT